MAEGGSEDEWDRYYGVCMLTVEVEVGVGDREYLKGTHNFVEEGLKGEEGLKREEVLKYRSMKKRQVEDEVGVDVGVDDNCCFFFCCHSMKSPFWLVLRVNFLFLLVWRETILMKRKASYIHSQSMNSSS